MDKAGPVREQLDLRETLFGPVRVDEIHGAVRARARHHGGNRVYDGAKLTLRQPQLLLRLFAIGNIGIGLEDRERPPTIITLQRPAARRYHPSPLAGRVNELSFPAPGPEQLRIDLFKRSGEHRLQKLVSYLSDRVVGRPPIKLFGTLVPVSYDILHVAHED